MKSFLTHLFCFKNTFSISDTATFSSDWRKENHRNIITNTPETCPRQNKLKNLSTFTEINGLLWTKSIWSIFPAVEIHSSNIKYLIAIPTVIFIKGESQLVWLPFFFLRFLRFFKLASDGFDFSRFFESRTSVVSLSMADFAADSAKKFIQPYFSGILHHRTNKYYCGIIEPDNRMVVL